MIKKFMSNNKNKNFRALMDSSDTIYEDLKDEFPYEEILASIIPMSFENPLAALDCNLVACSTNEGTKMGFMLEDTKAILIMTPKIEEKKLDIGIAFIQKKILYSSGTFFNVDWTMDLKEDCLLWMQTIENELEFFVGLIALLGIPEDAPIQ